MPVPPEIVMSRSVMSSPDLLRLVPAPSVARIPLSAMSAAPVGLPIRPSDPFPFPYPTLPVARTRCPTLEALLHEVGVPRLQRMGPLSRLPTAQADPCAVLSSGCR